ncbi:hypothetical protein J2T57_001502 [Natronocella acetinitrilica]|uniref:Uncharacterized protein n=1 Tax=Natronocella acetinitrilica TaxID=414046 RepID=A0AAE3G2A2_9GAMM|nr:hypothetical protein [Natronocella acetinitrilica]MCP1674400.1 hypothetical protein [Natronocella acetinitrilica]
MAHCPSHDWDSHYAMEEAANTPPTMTRVVCFDPDCASYLGSGDDGVYYQVEELTQEEIDAHDESDFALGWYVTVVVDSDTGAFVDTLVADAGPFPSREEALRHGRGIARDWCADNDIVLDDD